ncbi:uncharacterized protein LOC132990138 [Labrus mixtus]|uniref:uncharacterized protein LOC132990138 n=1 Tax=Labrus mixtus TaxID=508554 RepID=UPI0029C0E4F3|nr:uncharacterized protein LOC132990138 [Labrus mixtus]XP_060914217.1 uncharacterized protein LOC132990138 [Labrus mixtus]
METLVWLEVQKSMSIQQLKEETSLLNAFSMTLVNGRPSAGMTVDLKTFLATSGVRAQRGRYSMEYNEEELGASMITLYVSITNLLKSDSGRYSCVFGTGRYPHESQKFDLRVEDAPTTAQPKWTSPAFSPTPPASTLKTTLTLTTPAADQGLNQEANTRVQLYVRLVLVIMIIVSSAVALIVCRRSARRPGEPDEELDYINITNANLVHEGVREEILEI